MLQELLEKRDLIPILKMNDGTDVTIENWQRRRQEMKEALEKYSYGHTPDLPIRVWTEELEEEPEFLLNYGGKVRQEKRMLFFETAEGICSFSFVLAIPLRVEKPPVFIHLAFRRDLPDRYVPVEEITDQGFALAVVCYEDIMNDSHYGDFSGGMGAHFNTGQERSPEEWGKIGMWAYGASRILDYLLTRNDLDAEHTTVIGHSRLGKTALWTAAQDERFWAVIANNSGYGGAATSKHGEGERVRSFLRVGSWDWYCENFKLFVDEKEDEKPYDQAFLLALIAPRYLLVGSASEDYGADPKSEFLTSLWAAKAWELLGKTGLVTPDRMPEPGAVLHEGSVGYHIRDGRHFLSREDWNYYIQYLKRRLYDPEDEKC